MAMRKPHHSVSLLARGAPVRGGLGGQGGKRCAARVRTRRLARAARATHVDGGWRLPQRQRGYAPYCLQELPFKRLISPFPRVCFERVRSLSGLLVPHVRVEQPTAPFGRGFAHFLKGSLQRVYY